MLKGSCLCKDITFEVSGTPQGAAACHCDQCRKQSGHFWAAAAVPRADLSITGTPAWFEASDAARRGFCPRCGSFLFWKAHDEGTMSFALGAIDGPTGLRLTRHIFCDDKGDYYQIEHDAAQHAQS